MSKLLALFDRPVVENTTFSAFTALQQEEPKLRRRDMADKLGVPEADLVDSQCGVQSIRLTNKFKKLIKEFPSLGYVMSLTRNNGAVHERKGEYSNVKFTGPMGLVITEDRKIDLRIIAMRWAYGFAVAEDTPRGKRFSFQFFDKAGIAIQKVFLQPESNEDAYIDLVNAYRNPEQQEALEFDTTVVKPEYVEDSEVDVEALREEWQKMTDVHQFYGMLRRYNVSREQAFRLAGAPNAEPIATNVLEGILNQAAETQLPIMCFVGNHGNIQIHTGPVSNIKIMGPWLNVLDPEFSLHLMQSEIAAGWLVRKPTEDGTVTSLEFYDKDGETIAQFFGAREEGNPENAEWRALAESTLTSTAA